MWTSVRYSPKMSEHFGNFIRWKRARLGLNKREFAKKLGVDPKTITNLERREVPDGTDDVTIARIAEAFGVPEPEILEWHKVWPPQQQSKAYELPISLEQQAEIEQRAANADVSGNEWVAIALQSILETDWVPGEFLKAIKDTAPPHTEAPSTRVLHGGGAGRKAAKK